MRGLRILFELLLEARLALAANKGRTMLSVIGIAVGIAAVMTVSAVSSGGRAFVMKELETFGLRSVWVYRSSSKKDPHKRSRSGSGINSNDLRALQDGCCPAVRRLSPVVRPERTLVVQMGNRYTSASVQGVDASYTQINNDRVQVGRGIRDAEIQGRRPVALIGSAVVSDLFQNMENPVGQSIRIDGREYRVVGLLEYKSRDLLTSINSAGGGNVNSRILIPYTLVQGMNGNADVNYIQAEAVSLKQAENAASQLAGVLERRYHGTFGYEKSTLASYLKTVDRILGGVTLMGVVAASTALLVGAIGVAGIMSTAVAERTREIGIRAAIGAHRWHIMTQFVVEAILISLLGGVIGLVVGMTIGVILDAVTGFPLLPDLWGVLVALCVSIIVGLAAGYYPAKRAAQMKPVDALRMD